MITERSYASFEHPIDVLTKYYASSSGLFTIMLSNGLIIHFEPDDSHDFANWLNNHKIENIGNNI